MHVFAHLGQTAPSIRNVPQTPICAQGQVWNEETKRCEASSSGPSGVAVVLVGLIVVGALVAVSQ